MVATVDEEKQTHQIGFKQVLDEINETYDLWVKSEYDSFHRSYRLGTNGTKIWAR